MTFSSLAKWLIFFGIGLIFLGLLVWLGSKFHLPFGKLPGDIHVEKGKTSFYFPLVTCIFLSILITVILNLLFWIFRK